MRKFFLKSTDSTMKVAKDECLSCPPHEFCLVSAEMQTSGRGSQGRKWECAEGNIFLTLSAPRKLLNPGYPLSLLVGNVLYDVLSGYLAKERREHAWIKWPNDILIRQKKVSGILIESTESHFHIGIGINTRQAPKVRDGGRESTSLYLAGEIPADNREIIDHLSQALASAISAPPSPADLIKTVSQKIDWTRPIYKRSNPAEALFPIRLDAHGRLIAEDAKGRPEILSTDYLV